MSRASYALYFEGDAVANGEMSIGDLAPALLAFGGLCNEANVELNGNDAKVDVKIRAFAPGSFGIEIMVGVGLLTGAATIFRTHVKAAREVVGLISDSVDLVKKLRGKSVKDETEISDGVTRLSMDHNHTIDVSDRVYDFLKRGDVQKNLRDLISPLRSDDIDRLRLVQDDKTVGEIDAIDVPYFEVLPGKNSVNQEENILETTSTVEKWYTVMTVSNKRNLRWRLGDGGSEIRVQVADHLRQRAEAGTLGIEPGFVIRGRIKSVTHFENGNPITENTLEDVLDIKHPEVPKDERLI